MLFPSPMQSMNQDSVPASESKLTVWAWLMRHWESMALIAVIVAIISLLTLVLFPLPQQELTLKEVPLMTPKAASVIDDSLPLGQELESEENGFVEKQGAVISTKKAHYHFAPKKPKHPPITSLNKATLAQLQLLPGIGPKMAQRVLAYRHEHGAFTDVNQIMDVKGIGPKKFEKMKPFLKL
jgi:comEA protein